MRSAKLGAPPMRAETSGESGGAIAAFALAALRCRLHSRRRHHGSVMRAGARRDRRVRIRSTAAAGDFRAAGATLDGGSEGAQLAGRVARRVRRLSRARLSRRPCRCASSTQVAWVWDVYDADQRRAFRIAGEEAGRARRPGRLGAADDAGAADASPAAAWISSWPSSARRRRVRRASRRRPRTARLAGRFPARRRRSAPRERPLTPRRPQRTPRLRPRRMTQSRSRSPYGAVPPTASRDRKGPGQAARPYCQPRTALLSPPRAPALGEADETMAAKNGAIKLVAGNSNPRLAEAIGAYLEDAADQGGGAPLRRHGDLRRDPGERPRRGRVRDPVDVLPGQRPPDGTADHHRRAAPRVGAPHHGGDPLFRLCPAGPQTGPAHADLGQAGRQPDHPRRRRSRDDARPACRADPGLLRHSDRQSLRVAGDGARHPRALRSRQTHGGVARRRRRGARARARQAHQRAARHHRQAPRARRRIRSDERHRRRRRAAPASWSTTSSIPAARW